MCIHIYTYIHNIHTYTCTHTYQDDITYQHLRKLALRAQVDEDESSKDPTHTDLLEIHNATKGMAGLGTGFGSTLPPQRRDSLSSIGSVGSSIMGLCAQGNQVKCGRLGVGAVLGLGLILGGSYFKEVRCFIALVC